jgi:hypothetical protein
MKRNNLTICAQYFNLAQKIKVYYFYIILLKHVNGQYDRDFFSTCEAYDPHLEKLLMIQPCH